MRWQRTTGWGEGVLESHVILHICPPGKYGYLQMALTSNWKCSPEILNDLVCSMCPGSSTTANYTRKSNGRECLLLSAHSETHTSNISFRGECVNYSYLSRGWTLRRDDRQQQKNCKTTGIQLWYDNSVTVPVHTLKAGESYARSDESHQNRDKAKIAARCMPAVKASRLGLSMPSRVIVGTWFVD